MAASEIFRGHARRLCTSGSGFKASNLGRSALFSSPSGTSDLGFCDYDSLHSSPFSSTPRPKPLFFHESVSFYLNPYTTDSKFKLPFFSDFNPFRFRFLGFNRSIHLSAQFCSSSSSDSQSETASDDSRKGSSSSNENFRKVSTSSSTIKPVSYSLKPKEQVESEDLLPSQPKTPPIRQRDARKPVFREQESRFEPAEAEARQWTREDIRYVKDIPAISPVSYPTRVAPLPEDKISEEKPVEEEKKEVEADQDVKRVQLDHESRRIQSELRIRRVLRTEEENLPFPTIIKPEKKKPKVVLDLQDAIREVKANAKRKFTETVEAHVNLGVDPRRGDQMVRGAATLPHGTGKIVRVAVFAEGAAADEARAAGADIVGGDALIDEIKNGGGKLNFDKCISTPTFMPRLGKIARILGPRGLMPNPKLGSVTSDVAVAVQEAKRGRIDFKIDKTAIVHVGLGKVNFSEESLRENVGAFVNALLLAKPVGLKKTSKYAGYVNSFTLSSTMGPGFPVSIQSLSIAADQCAKLKPR